MAASIALLTLSACASATTPPVEKPPLDPSLTQPCPPLAADLATGEAGELLAKLVEVAGLYYECAARHEGLVKSQ